jgi:MFS family permease
VSAPEGPQKRGAGVLVRAALGLYPPAWRARYGAEVLALLDDTGGGAPAAASLAWHAVPVWVCPPRQLHDGSARIRSSIATTGIAWALLAGLAAVFTQLTQAQGSTQGATLAQHPVIQWSYWAFDGLLVVSVLAVAVGGIPLWLLMLRTAPRRREMAWLLAPAVVPAAFLLAAFAIGSLVGRSGSQVVPGRSESVTNLANGGVGPWWFLALVVLGFAAAVLSAAGPALALRRLRPDGPAVVLAARAAALAAGTMALACAASVVAAVGLYLWAPAYAGYQESWPLAVYLPAVLLAAAVAVVSAARGLRARPPVAA